MSVSKADIREYNKCIDWFFEAAPQSDYILQKEADQQIFDCWSVPFCRIQDPILSRFKINRTSPRLDFVVLLFALRQYACFLLAPPSASCSLPLRVIIALFQITGVRGHVGSLGLFCVQHQSQA